MLTIYKHETKNYIKSLIIWFLCVGGMGFACVLLFSTMEDTMASMADSFASCLLYTSPSPRDRG